MNNLIPLFADNILPIFITAAAGWLIGKVSHIDAKTVARIAFYVFSPALVFQLITHNNISSGDFARMSFLAIAVTGLVGLLVWLVGKSIKLERRMLAALLLVTMFPNAGNFGLSANRFAFGEEGLAHASIYFVTMATLTYSLGALIASMGKKSFREAALGLLKIPVLYALTGAYLFNMLDWSLPTPVARSVALLSQAAIPTMLLLLGLQLQRIIWSKDILALSLANVFRLLVSPLAAIGLGLAIGLEGLPLQAGVLEAAMPSAVMTIILSTEFDVEPAFVTTAVTTTTLLSPLTITPLLALLGQ